MIQWEQRVIALAGLIQATQLVAQLARRGMMSQDTFEVSIGSIFVQNPGSVAEVYSGTRGIRSSLVSLREMLTRFDSSKYGESLGYGMAIINLERKLSRNPAMLREIGAQIENIDEQRMLRANQSPDIDELCISQLAKLYESTLSHIEPRIKVLGDQQRLKSTETVEKIRALLLAAVRAAVLWRQVGGHRWQLLLARKQMKDAIDNLL